VYDLVLSVPGDLLQGVGNRNAGIAALGSLLGLVAGLLFAFIAPALYLQTYRRGFNGGFDVGGVWAMATGNTNASVIGGLIWIVAGIISIAGFIACCVGLIFTIPYAAAITAGVVIWYERQVSGPAELPAQPA
ncbi:MAG TPA: hypothetical protein VLK30_12110, partial [Candidatus Limnocylindrales bacterium]|nr:hypothetical protein [Candidatus Limnocylindrales bacterium]